MLPESYLNESKRMLAHYVGAKLAANFSSQSAYEQAQIVGWLDHHIKVVARESERAAVYINSGVDNPRRDMLISLKAECLQLAADAEAALA